MCEVVGVGLGNELAHIGLLDEVLVALLVGKVDSILLGLELESLAVHEVCRRGPAHKRVLPSVALGKDVPVHEPVFRCPVAGLCGGLCGLVDAVHVSILRAYCASLVGLIPDLTGLEVDRRTGKNSRSYALTRLAAVHDALGDGREVAASLIS